MGGVGEQVTIAIVFGLEIDKTRFLILHWKTLQARVYVTDSRLRCHDVSVSQNEFEGTQNAHNSKFAMNMKLRSLEKEQKSSW